MLGLYNPGSIDNTDEGYLEAWNYNTQFILADDAKGLFIPTYSTFKSNLNRFIAEDKLHPNSMGYQNIAALISKSVGDTLQ